MHQQLVSQPVTAPSPNNGQKIAAEPPDVALIRSAVLDADPEFAHLGALARSGPQAALQDYIVASEDEPHDPDRVFARLRWGGQFVYISRNRKHVEELPAQFLERGFRIVHIPSFVRAGWRIPVLSPKVHFFIARKTALIPPREFSDRFTYQVELERRDQAQPDGFPAKATDHWIVRKEVPTYERVLARLQAKAPDAPPQVLQNRARKFVEQIFPLFLTREAAMLKIIERDCPPEYKNRFPRLVDMRKDSKGYVRQLWTTWLRNGGPRLSQLDFARQSAEVLHVLHDRIGIIHLDLRMDNMVISETGVGLIDFGSSVRVNENIQGNAVLSTLFGELMRTSQIQRMMDKMATAGSLTSSVIRDAHQRADKAVDVFYLAVQINQPTANPDLKDLVRFDKSSPEAAELSRLNGEILRPNDPTRPKYHTADDVLREIRRIEMELEIRRRPKVVITTPPDESSRPKVWVWQS
jgi:hypothetical protein